MGCFLTYTERDLTQTLAGLARTSPGLVNPYLSVLNSQVASQLGGLRYRMGKWGEAVAEEVLEQSGYEVLERATAQGVDIKARARDSGGANITVEVKTTVSSQDKSFSALLSDGYGHKQCSDGWLKAVGVDPTQATVVGVMINVERETISVCQRIDGLATDWRWIARDMPLSRYQNLPKP